RPPARTRPPDPPERRRDQAAPGSERRSNRSARTGLGRQPSLLVSFGRSSNVPASPPSPSSSAPASASASAERALNSVVLTVPSDTPSASATSATDMPR